MLLPARIPSAPRCACSPAAVCMCFPFSIARRSSFFPSGSALFQRSLERFVKTWLERSTTAHYSRLPLLHGFLLTELKMAKSPPVPSSSILACALAAYAYQIYRHWDVLALQPDTAEEEFVVLVLTGQLVFFQTAGLPRPRLFSTLLLCYSIRL